MSLDGKTVVVTGAPGWLGTRLVEALAGAAGDWPRVSGARVRCLTAPGADAATLKALGAETVAADLAREGDFVPLLRDAEVVIHAAGVIHPRRVAEFWALNARGTRALVAAAARAGVRRFLYVSSNSAGGVNRDPRVLLDESAAEPYLNYGASKRRGELAVLEAHAAGRLEAAIIRPCWFYGPGQPARQTRFFKMIQSGKPLIFGTGRYLRSMSYIDNIVQGALLAADLPQAAGQTYWIADERPYEVDEIWATVARVLGVRDFRPRHVPEPAARLCHLADAALQALGFYVQELHVAGELVEHIACSIEKAQRELGYAPKVALEEGMRRSVAWCRARGQL